MGTFHIPLITLHLICNSAKMKEEVYFLELRWVKQLVESSNAVPAGGREGGRLHIEKQDQTEELKVVMAHNWRKMCCGHLAQDLKSIRVGERITSKSGFRFNARYDCISVHIAAFSTISTCSVYVNDVTF